MITFIVTRAKLVGTGTINVRKQCGMRSRYTVKQCGSTRVNFIMAEFDLKDCHIDQGN